MAKNIVGLNIDGISYTNRPFGICETTGLTAVKEVNCADFVLVPNATILVKFTNTNEATQPKLKVNNTGEIPIKWNNSTAIGNKIKKEDVYEFIYDGANWLCLGGMDTNNAVTQIPTTSNITYPLLMGMNPASSSSQITAAVRYHSGLTYNPSTKILGLGVLNCTTNGSGDDSNKIDIYANSPLPTTYKIGFIRGADNTAPATSINLTYSGPGMTAPEAVASTGLTIGPKIVDDATTDGFLISTDKPLHIEGSSLSFGSNVIPNQNDTYNLGTADNKWNEVHAESFKGTADSARIIPYGVCATAGETIDKEVTTSTPFTLETGARISVKFNYSHTASTMTLNVNGTGAADVELNGSTTIEQYIFLPGNIYEFIYDSPNWILLPGVHNTAGSNINTRKLFLIGASSQSSYGARTYSNSPVYMEGGAIYTKGGFYDKSTTTGASVYKAVVPKDYTEDIGSYQITSTHILGGAISASIEVPKSSYGGLVGEFHLFAGRVTTLSINSTSISTLYSTTLKISMTSDAPAFRFVRLLISVPVTVQNNGNSLANFRYNVEINLNDGAYKTIYKSYVINNGNSLSIGTLSIIYDLMKETIVDDTANGTSSWI